MSVKYPSVFIRSANDLGKHISNKKFPMDQAMLLINDVKQNKDSYWKDNLHHSQIENEKFVRSAKGKPLGRLLEHINEDVLGPHDRLLSKVIFGGIQKSDHVKAASYLLGGKRKRTLLAMDIKSFFEQIHHDRVFHFFYKKCGCDKRIAKLFADLACVPLGLKGSDGQLVLARGFSTSSRLAIWTNVELFERMTHIVYKKLKGHDPRVAVFVDDIGITASRVSLQQMQELRDEIMVLFMEFDKNQPLEIHPISKKQKNKIVEHSEGIEHLGLRLYRNRLSVGAKTLSRKQKHENNREKLVTTEQREHHKVVTKGHSRYNGYVRSAKPLHKKVNDSCHK
jgi:hypothetical protein